jgi:enolase
MINGGAISGSRLVIQELMIVPTGATSFTEAMRMGTETYHHLEYVTEDKYGATDTNVGDEGGFTPNMDSVENGRDLIITAIDMAGCTGKMKTGIDCAASIFFKEDKYDLDYKNTYTDKHK